MIKVRDWGLNSLNRVLYPVFLIKNELYFFKRYLTTIRNVDYLSAEHHFKENFILNDDQCLFIYVKTAKNLIEEEAFVNTNEVIIDKQIYNNSLFQYVLDLYANVVILSVEVYLYEKR